MPRAARGIFFSWNPGRILIDDVSLNMFTNICRGLFEKDKMLYAFMIAIGVLRRAGEVSGRSSTVCRLLSYTQFWLFHPLTRSHLLLPTNTPYRG